MLDTHLQRLGSIALLAVALFVPGWPHGAAAETATAISAGEYHSCAVTSAGRVKCWGSNRSGQLGDGTGNPTGSVYVRGVPVDVVGLGSGVAGVSSGGSHSCALTTGGGVKCWGSNDGALGDGTGSTRSTPVDVVGLASGVVTVAAGLRHSCALTIGGGVKCWGSNEYGQLGDGTTTDSNTPVDVVDLTSGVVALSAGGDHTCALTSAGGLRCWGYNVFGQLGDDTTTDRNTPADVVGLTTGVTIVALGVHRSCAITNTGGLKCWGYNGGALGDGTYENRSAPVDVIGLTSDVVAVAGGSGYHSCAITSDGSLKCWGGNGYGEVGDGTTTPRPTPVDVMGVPGDVIAVAVGGSHTCAISESVGVLCWGSTLDGQLGNGISATKPVPSRVDALDGVGAVSVGNNHTCAITNAGGLKCWGYNGYILLGNGEFENRSAPVDVLGLTSGVVAVSAGALHTCAITSAGGLKCWGANSTGQLGDGTTITRGTPADVVGLTSGVVAVSVGAFHTCAITSAGGLKCWGMNFSGRVGDGTTTHRSLPVDVSGLTSGVAAVAAGESYTCAITSAGGAKCWGANPYGQLGDGTTTGRTVPVDVAGLTSGVSAISAGDHTCAVTSAGGLKCWGYNSDGAVGDGTTTHRQTPVDVAGLTSGIVAVAAGRQGSHTCAITSTGGLKCWGSNGSGQVGDGTTTSRSTPVDVVGLGSGVLAVAANGEHSCSMDEAGNLDCWGNNGVGQIGIGDDNVVVVPVAVLPEPAFALSLIAGAALLWLLARRHERGSLH